MPISDIDPLVALPMVTPFNEQDQVDYDAAQRNVERWINTPISAYIIGSQSGEEFYMSEPERVGLVRHVTEALDGDRFTVGGIDCPSVAETLRQAERHAEAGAEMVRVRFPRSEASVVPYFEQVLPRCPLPVLLMHQSDPTSFGVAARPAASPEVLGAVTSMEHVYGYVTDHDMRFEARVRRYVPNDKRFWICNGSMILSGTLIGCNGTTTAFANIWPEALHELLLLGMDGKYDQGEALQEQIRVIDEIMLPYLAAGIKACLGLMGFEGMTPRRPTNPMPADELQRLEQAMRQAKLI
jgi:dihydrodipicolinate synthase/N-acetylneuraminate lyase